MLINEYIQSSLVAQTVKNLPEMQKTWVCSLGWEDPLKEAMATHSSILVHGQRSLEGYSPWGRNKSDTTERLSTAQQNAVESWLEDIRALNT